MASKLAALGGAAMALLMVSSFPSRQTRGTEVVGSVVGTWVGSTGVGSTWAAPGSSAAPVISGFVISAAPVISSALAISSTGRISRGSRISRTVGFSTSGEYTIGTYSSLPILGAYAYSSYGYGCDWLRRSAFYSGSRYWWSRYYACLYGY